MPPSLTNDPRVEKLLASRPGQVLFAGAAGLLLFQTFTGFKALTEMMVAWDDHVGGTRKQLEDVAAKKPALPPTPTGYISCRMCFATIDERAKICPACRTVAPVDERAVASPLVRDKDAVAENGGDVDRSKVPDAGA